MPTRPPEWPNCSMALRYSPENGANWAGLPPMIASIMSKPCRAVRTTDSGEPPTPTHTGIRPPCSAACERGCTDWSVSGDRRRPAQVTGCSRTSAA
ncbi:MAG: hypothetical protein WC580_10015, partial [Agrococcus sp.]